MLDSIYGVDPRDNYTSAQIGNTPTGGYAQFLTNKHALAGATFGLPWNSFWTLADPVQLAQLVQLLDLIESAGATIINGTELPSAPLLVDPQGWNWYLPHISLRRPKLIDIGIMELKEATSTSLSLLSLP